MSTQEALDALIAKIDRSNPDGRDESGRPFWILRSVAGTRSCPHGYLPMTPVTRRAPAAAAVDGAPETRAREAAVEGEEMICEGTSSSTSRDYYGTRMSLGCITKMAQQMRIGVPYVPRHFRGGFLTAEPMEWDDVIGRTVEARVENAEVANPVDPGEQQYRLITASRLYPEEPKAQELQRRLLRGEPIGQSIGGWFVEIRVITDENDEVIDVIVEEIELDHLAVTRMPANGDSNDLSMLRAKLLDAFRIGVRPVVRTPEETPQPVAEASAATEPEPEPESEPEVKDRKGRVEPGGECLSISEEDGEVRVHWSASAPPEAIRSGVEALLDGARGDRVRDVVRSVLSAAQQVRGAGTAPGDGVDAGGGAPEVVAALDTTVSPTQDDGDHPADAPRSAPPASDDQPEGPPQENVMPDSNPLDVVLAEIRGLGTRITALEARSTPAAAPTPAASPVAEPNPELDALRSQLADANRKLDTVLSQPMRRGLAAVAPTAASAISDYNVRNARSGGEAIRSLIARAKTSDNPGEQMFARVVEEQLPVLAEKEIGKIDRSVLEECLRNICGSAEDAGLISDPSLRSSWA